MKNMKISILCTMMIATSMSASDYTVAAAMTKIVKNAAELELTDPIAECAKAKAIHDYNGRVEDARIQAMEAELKKCLIKNLHNTNLGSFKIPVGCVEQARIFMIEAGRDRACEIIADFKAARE